MRPSGLCALLVAASATASSATFDTLSEGATIAGFRTISLYLDAADHPNLVPVMPEVPSISYDVHLVYADALRQSKRVAAFRDFAVKASKDWQY